MLVDLFHVISFKENICNWLISTEMGCVMLVHI